MSGFPRRGLSARKLPFPEAVEKAVDYCIKHGILANFLTKNRAEAIDMSIFEFDEEKFIKTEREYAYERGLEKSRALKKYKIKAPDFLHFQKFRVFY